MAPKSKSSPEIRARLAAQKQASASAVRNRTATRTAVAKSGKGLPPAGGTGAGSVGARGQRLATAVSTKVRNDTTILKGLADNMKRNVARDSRASGNGSGTRMTSGSTRYVPPGGENAAAQKLLKAGTDPRTGPSSRLPTKLLKASPKPPAPSSPLRSRALAPGKPGGPLAQRGGALATRPSSALTAPSKPGTPADTVRGSGVRTGQPGATRPSLGTAKPTAATASAGEAAGTAGRVAGTLGKAGKFLGAAGLVTGIVTQVADVIKQGRKTGKMFHDLTTPSKTSTNTAGPKGTGSGSRQSSTMADIRGTGRQVTPPAPAKPPSSPDKAPQTGGGGSVSPSVGRGAVGRPSVVSRVSSGTAASASPTSSPATASSGEYKTDSWSINFLRQRRAAERALASRKAPDTAPPAPTSSDLAIPTKSDGPLTSNAGYLAKAKELNDRKKKKS